MEVELSHAHKWWGNVPFQTGSCTGGTSMNGGLSTRRYCYLRGPRVSTRRVRAILVKRECCVRRCEGVRGWRCEGLGEMCRCMYVRSNARNGTFCFINKFCSKNKTLKLIVQLVLVFWETMDVTCTGINWPTIVGKFQVQIASSKMAMQIGKHTYLWSSYISPSNRQH